MVLHVDGQAHPKAEFRVVFKQRIRPGRAPAIEVLRVRRRREIAAVNRGTAGRVADDGAVSEELGHQLDIRSFATAGAGAAELEERLEKLYVLDLRERDFLAVKFGDVE